MTSSATMPLNAVSIAIAGAGVAAARGRMGAARAQRAHRRCELGSVQIDAYRSNRQQDVPVTASEATIVLVVATAGAAECIAAGGSEQRRLLAGSTVTLLARPGHTKLRWYEGSEGLLLRLPRTPLQILASADGGQAIRIAARDAVVTASGEMMVTMKRLAAWIWAGRETERERDDWQSAINDSIVDGLLGGADWGRLTVVSRAAQQVLTAIAECAEAPLDLDRFAASHGITLRTLREAVSACFGKPLSAFVQEARLRHARERLSSGFDSRAVQAIAEAAGFQNASSFARAYSRCFGESPTQTRARSIGI